MSWIDHLIRHLEQVACSSCGERYRRDGIAAVVTERSRLIVRMRCRSCGEDGIAILDHGAAANEPPGEPITSDDVLDAHDLLARDSHPPAALFSTLSR